MTASRSLRLLFMLTVAMSAACVGQDTRSKKDSAPSPSADATNAFPCKAFASDNKLELISRLCVFAQTYREKMPALIVQQTTTSHGPTSTVVITAQAAFRRGQEQHSLVTVNGKPMSPTGRYSADLRLFTNGEFGPLLINLFRLPGAVEFAFNKNDSLLGTTAAVFDFHISKKKNTFWAIRTPAGETIKPEFNGHLWLATPTGTIMREEVEPVVDPRETFLASLKLTTDYSAIQVSDLGTFVLPVKSESIMCMGRSLYYLGCTTNSTVFHDYRKFVDTSAIIPGEPAH